MNEYVPYRASKQAIANPQHMQVEVQSLPLVMFIIYICVIFFFSNI